MSEALADRIAAAVGQRPERLVPLAGGDIGTVTRADFADGMRIVAKEPGGIGADTAAIEAHMLRHLRAAADSPVPEVLHVERGLLLISWLPGESGLAPAAEAHAGRMLARLHAAGAERFGFECDTVIGPLPQPNPQMESWCAFFRENRLNYMARCAHEAGRLPASLRRRVENLADRLETWIDQPAAPELVHGDLWSGNLLCAGDRLTGLLDPAIYYGHGEVDLAFLTLFGSPGERFFDAYHECRPLAPGFFEARRELYNLWPLLVHVRLFGGGYAGSVERILERFGA